MAVYNELGHGYVVGIYRDALAIECDERNIPYGRDIPITVHYRGHDLDSGYTADFVCCEDILIVVKVVEALDKPDDMELSPGAYAELWTEAAGISTYRGARIFGRTGVT